MWPRGPWLSSVNCTMLAPSPSPFCIAVGACLVPLLAFCKSEAPRHPNTNMVKVWQHDTILVAQVHINLG